MPVSTRNHLHDEAEVLVAQLLRQVVEGVLQRNAGEGVLLDEGEQRRVFGASFLHQTVRVEGLDLEKRLLQTHLNFFGRGGHFRGIHGAYDERDAMHRLNGCCRFRLRRFSRSRLRRNISFSSSLAISGFSAQTPCPTIINDFELLLVITLTLRSYRAPPTIRSSEPLTRFPLCRIISFM